MTIKIPLLLSTLFLILCFNAVGQEKKDLFKTVQQMDSLLFLAFNSCDTTASKGFFTKDLEFYHDKGGLTNYDDNIRSILKRCNSSFVVRRELVEGTMEVYSIKDFGAIQTGTHRFYIKNKGEAEILDGTFKFVHVWKLENGKWRIARVISFDH